jgi:hypothetical protein
MADQILISLHIDNNRRPGRPGRKSSVYPAVHKLNPARFALGEFSATPFRLKQTCSIATMDFGASDHALAQIIHGRFIWTFRSGNFNFDIYTDRALL